jgi:beta-galactosidase
MQKQSLNRAWRFFLGDPAQTPPTDLSGWRTLDLPHDWSIELERNPSNPSGLSNGWFAMGRGWYAHEIDAPDAWRGKIVRVEFEGVYMNAEVWLNEDYLGRHPYGYTSFVLDLTPYLHFGKRNVLTVRVDNSAQLNSRWYSGSGIYRPVWLYVAEPVHVAHWGVSITTPTISADQAAVRAQTRVENQGDAPCAVQLESRIYDPAGQLVASATTEGAILAGADYTFEQALDVAQPRLWSPQSPALYRLDTQVQVEGRVADETSTTFGIRSIAYSAEQGFLLNGESIKMKGGCVHHDNGIVGAASFPRAEERKVELLKASGFDAIRCAHNPPAPAFLDACDRLGMLVIDEAFDCWREGKNPFDYHLSFDDWWPRDIESMVRRDRNHPSVVIWSIGNEVLERDGRSGGAAIARALAQHTRRLDPTRPVTVASCDVFSRDGRKWPDADAVFAALDLCGYNYQWREYVNDHARCPQRIMMGTETFPIEAYDNWTRVLALPYVVGDFVWTSMDYLGESGIGRVYLDDKERGQLGAYPWHHAYCGDIDLAGFKRPQSYYRDILWENGQPLYIAVHAPVPAGKTPHITLWGWPDVRDSWTWPTYEGQTFNVDVYAACDEVELFLNGQSLGRQPVRRNEAPTMGEPTPLFVQAPIAPQLSLTASFSVPYAPGELKAVGYTAGQPVAQTALNTVGAAQAVTLAPERTEIPAAPDSLCYVTVEVVDAQGRRQPNAENALFFTVQGAGEVFAVGNGNPISTESYKGNQRRAYQGRAVVVVKSSGQPGEMRLRAQADGLDAADVVIRVV